MLRDLIKEALLRDRKRRKKAQHLAGIKPTTSRVLLRCRVLYRCATTTAPCLCNLDPGVWASTAMTVRGFKPMTPGFGELPLPQCHPPTPHCLGRAFVQEDSGATIQPIPKSKKGKIFTFHQNLTNLFGEHIFGNCLKLIDKNLFFSFQLEKIFKFVSWG